MLARAVGLWALVALSGESFAATGGILNLRTREIIAGASRVEVYRAGGRVPGNPALGGLFSLVSEPVPLPAGSLPSLLGLLKDASRFDTQSLQTCVFKPELAFRVWKGTRYFDLLLSFECLDVMVIEQDETIEDGFEIAGIDKAGAQLLLGFGLQAFPGTGGWKGCGSEAMRTRPVRRISSGATAPERYGMP